MKSSIGEGGEGQRGRTQELKALVVNGANDLSDSHNTTERWQDIIRKGEHIWTRVCTRTAAGD